MPQLKLNVLQEADEIVSGPRNGRYGHPRQSFGEISSLWSIILGTRVTADQVAECQVERLEREGPEVFAQSLSAEEWRPVRGFEQSYLVSSIGRVHSLPRAYHPQGGPVNQRISRSGYMVLALCTNSKRQPKQVHRLVCDTFHGPIGVMTTNHINGCKRDNTTSNLEPATQLTNNIHAIQSGLRGRPNVPACNGKAKLTANQVLAIRSSSAPDRTVAREHSVAAITISRIRKRLVWKNI